MGGYTNQNGPPCGRSIDVEGDTDELVKTHATATVSPCLIRSVSVISSSPWI